MIVIVYLCPLLLTKREGLWPPLPLDSVTLLPSGDSHLYGNSKTGLRNCFFPPHGENLQAPWNSISYNFLFFKFLASTVVSVKGILVFLKP